MVDVLVRNWWTLVLRGMLAILFGIMAWVWPGVTLGVLIMFQPIAGAYAIGVLIGIYAFIHGCLLIALGFEVRKLPQGPVAPAAA